VEGASAAGRSAILYLPTPPAAPSLFLSFALLLLPSEYKSFYTGIKESRRRWVYRKEKKKRERCIENRESYIRKWEWFIFWENWKWLNWLVFLGGINEE
jgi:hypothetical protein